METFLKPLLILFWIFCICHNHVESCSKSSISIKDNGFTNIVIGIDNSVPEDITLIDRIEEIFTRASALLYTATRYHTYFKEIIIFIPQSWKNYVRYERSNNETFKESDIKIITGVDSDEPNRPFTIQPGICGDEGISINLTPDFILNDDVGSIYGEYEKVIVHEWARFRYGVYSEDAFEEDGRFYISEEGKIEASRCPSALEGNYVKQSDQSTECSRESNDLDQFRNSSCIFVENENQSPLGSLMYRPDLNYSMEFCDDDSSKPLTFHNKYALNEQNKMCDYKSIWEVMRSHTDFIFDANPSAENLISKPNFRLKKDLYTRMLVIFDTAASISLNGRFSIMNETIRSFLKEAVDSNDEVGLMEAGNAPSMRSSLSKVDDAEDLISVMPDDIKCFSCVGGAMEKALHILKEDSLLTLDSLLVVTDCTESTFPYFEDIQEEILKSGVVVNVVVIGDTDECILSTIANETGGYSFMYPDQVPVENITQDLSKLKVKDSEGDTDETINQHSGGGSGVNGDSGLFNIDTSIGFGTTFIFISDISSMFYTVISPSGKSFKGNSSDNSLGGISRSVKLRIPGIAETGTWKYKIDSDIKLNEGDVTVKLKSQPIDGSSAIHTSISWIHDEVNLDLASPLIQTIFAGVSKGHNPVLNVNVTAHVKYKDETKYITLKDSGTGADNQKNDGIYSAYFINFVDDGSYDLSVLVTSKKETIVDKNEVIGSKRTRNKSIKNARKQRRTVAVNSLERFKKGGQFILKNYDPLKKDSYYPPSKITDLHIIEFDEFENVLKLGWTAVGRQLDVGTAFQYELRVAESFEDMTDNHRIIKQDEILSGFNISSPELSGNYEFAEIQLSNDQEQFVFRIAAMRNDVSGEMIYGELSNMVRVKMPNHRSELENNNTTDSNDTVAGNSTGTVDDASSNNMTESISDSSNDTSSDSEKNNSSTNTENNKTDKDNNNLVVFLPSTVIILLLFMLICSLYYYRKQKGESYMSYDQEYDTLSFKSDMSSQRIHTRMDPRENYSNRKYLSHSHKRHLPLKW